MMAKVKVMIVLTKRRLRSHKAEAKLDRGKVKRAVQGLRSDVALSWGTKHVHVATLQVHITSQKCQCI